jgi:hypothetical protein
MQDDIDKMVASKLRAARARLQTRQKDLVAEMGRSSSQ